MQKQKKAPARGRGSGEKKAATKGGDDGEQPAAPPIRVRERGEGKRAVKQPEKLEY